MSSESKLRSGDSRPSLESLRKKETPLQPTTILLGSNPPKLLCKHDKPWTHSIFTTCTQLIYSLQSHVFKHQPSASPGPAPSLTSSPASPPSDDTQCQVCHSPFDEEKMLHMRHNLRHYRLASTSHSAPPCIFIDIPQHYSLKQVFPPYTSHKICNLHNLDSGCTPPPHHSPEFPLVFIAASATSSAFGSA